MECTCQAFEYAPQPGDMPPLSVVVSQAEMTQLRSKVQVYETRNETQVNTIETLKRELNQKDGITRAQELALEVAEKVITELKTELGGTRFLLSMMVDTGALPESFAKTFMPTMPMVGDDDEHGYFEGETGPMAVAIILDEDPDYRG
jgi:hypothetical protein